MNFSAGLEFVKPHVFREFVSSVWKVLFETSAGNGSVADVGAAAGVPPPHPDIITRILVQKSPPRNRTDMFTFVFMSPPREKLDTRSPWEGRFCELDHDCSGIEHQICNCGTSI